MSTLSYSTSTRVTQNGKTLQVSGWHVKRHVDKLLLEWEIDLLVPVKISSTDKFSIYRSFGPWTKVGVGYMGDCPEVVGSGGALFGATGSSVAGGDVIKDAVADGWDFFMDSMELATKIYGKSTAMGSISQQAPEKSLYFINSDWLNSISPDGWTLSTDGCIYHRGNPGQPGGRLYWDDLPSADMAVGTFECIVGDASHQAVSRYLANLLGCEFFSNCPPIRINKVFVASATRKVYDAIWELNKLWNPTMSVEHGTSRPRIVILDTAGTSQSKKNPGGMNLTGAAVEFQSRENLGDEGPVNHVIVQGAKDSASNSIEFASKQAELKTLAIVPLSEDKVLQKEEIFTDLWNKKRMGDYKKKFAKATTGAQMLRPQATKSLYYYYFHVDPKDPSNLILVREVQELYTDQGLHLRTVTKHDYAKGFEPVGSTEEEWYMLQVPGQPGKQMVKVRIKHHDQSRVYEGIKASLAKELTEELIVATKVEPENEEPFYTGPMRLIQAVEGNFVSDTPNTTQKLLELTTKSKNTVVDRVTPKLMIQGVTEFDSISGAVKKNTQFIKDPNKNVTIRDKESRQYVKEYWQGQGPYNPAKIVSHPDITDDTISDQVAERCFSRNGEAKVGINVKLSGPVIVNQFPVSVTVPSFSFNASQKSGPPSSSTLMIKERAHFPASKYEHGIGYAVGASAGGGGAGAGRTLDWLCVGTEETLTTNKDNVGGFDHEIQLNLRNVL